MWNYKDKEKFEEEKGIINAFKIEAKIDVETALEVNSECGIISTFKANKKKSTEEQKMKVMISKLRRNEK